MREVEAAEELISGNIELSRQHFRYAACGHGGNIVVEFAAEEGQVTEVKQIRTQIETTCAESSTSI